MKWIFLITVIVVISIWEIIFLPKKIEKNIIAEVNDMGGNVLSLESIGIRDQIYLVVYEIGGEEQRRNVKCSSFGKITEWI